ncbi:hypothetical protein BD626DRAFT_488356 [Schizophyllum amplum]|uniref:Uncharacterized protein n=1 Tax=Schizophyllum amplum TaxID=97359 RepID=A0A550CKK1_9AGAR|nr:hypothetical protein BD626DRAFT_488356 [Auriculariopsis ampla]
MLGIILRRAFPAHEICTSVAYALARPPWTRSRPLVFGRYRRATILVRERGDAEASTSASRNISRISQSSEAGDDMHNNSDSADDPIYDDAYYAYVDAHYVEMRGGDENNQESSTQSSVPSFWTSQQLLCATESKPQTPAHLCVAHADGILHLMTSGLYHRLAVGVEGPLIGLSYTKASPVVVMHIAWLGEDIADGDTLPVAHFLPHMSSHDSMVSFDLRFIMDAFRLALALYRYGRLAAQIPRVQQVNSVFAWRADLCARDAIEDDEPCPRSDCDSDEYIARWASNVNETTVPFQDANDTDSQFSQETPLRHQLSQSPGMGLRTNANMSDTASSRSSRSSQPTTESQPESDAPAQQQMYKTDSVGGSSGPESVKAFFTSSDFVRRPKCLRLPHTQRFFVLRKVRFCSLQKENGAGQAPKETFHALAPTWFYGDTVNLGRHILTEQDKLLKELLIAHANQSTCFIGYVTKGVQALVERSLAAVLHVVEAARLLDEQRKEGIENDDRNDTSFEVLNEATHRSLWDQLFRKLVDSSDDPHIRYRREPKLRYPEYPSGDTDDATGSVFDFYQNIHPFSLTGEDEARFQWWYEVYADKERTDLVNAAREEPRSGIADGILYLKVKDIFPNNAVADAVAVWTPDVGAGPMEQDESIAAPWTRTDSPSSEARFAGSVFSCCSRLSFSDQDRAEYQQFSVRRVEPDPSPTINTTIETTDLSSVPIETQVPAECKSNRETTLTGSDGYFPLIVSEFKKVLKGWSAEAASDQERLHLVAICTFLRLFNVGRFPIFGLVTSGSTGVLSSAWNEAVAVKDTVHDTICIADQQAVEVHLQSPLDLLNVATWIAYIIVEHAPRLQKLLEASTLEDVEQAYLLNVSGPIPSQQARSMTVEDGSWHKPL